MCLANNEVHRTKTIVTLHEVTWLTDGEMLYQVVENEIHNCLKNRQKKKKKKKDDLSFTSAA